jgi:phosphatidylglycerophosphatase A
MLPGAPGTWGSLATVILLYPALWAAGDDSAAWVMILGAGVVVFSILAVLLGNHAVEDFGREDPGAFVLDEAAGICLTLMFVPPRTGVGLIVTLAVAFGAFRLFDVTKPPPARQLERLHGGWGILLDDLAAGVYANIVCQIVLRALVECFNLMHSYSTPRAPGGLFR